MLNWDRLGNLRRRSAVGQNFKPPRCVIFCPSLLLDTSKQAIRAIQQASVHAMACHVAFVHAMARHVAFVHAMARHVACVHAMARHVT